MSHKNKNSADRVNSDTPPTATNVDWPVYVPNADGSTNIEVGKARLRYGTLVVEFKDSAPAVAIQRMIERGVLVGFGMVMVQPDVVNEMYQGVVAREEEEAAALKAGLEDGSIVFDEESGEFRPVDALIVQHNELERLVDEEHITGEEETT